MTDIDSNQIAAHLAVLSGEERARISQKAKQQRINYSDQPRHAIALRMDVEESRLTYLEKRLPKRITGEELARWADAIGVAPRWFIESKSEPQVERAMPQCGTVAEEIRRLGGWLSRKNILTRTFEISELNAQDRRNADMFAQRYGVQGEDKATLEECAAPHALTRESARLQIDKLSQRLPDFKEQLPQIERLRVQIEDHLPAPQAELDQQLRGLLGEQLSVLGAQRFCHECLGFNLIGTFGGIGPQSKAGPPIIMPPQLATQEGADAIRVVRESALRMIRVVGAAQIDYVCGDSSDNLKQPHTKEQIKRLVRTQPGFEWLIERDGWFWFGPERENRLLTATKKMLAVAGDRLDVELIHGGLTRVRLERYMEDRKSRIIMDPPQPVIVEVLSRTPWLKKVQQNDFRVNEPIDPGSVLGKVEAHIYQSMIAHGNVMSLGSMKVELIDSGLVLNNTLPIILDSSPIVRKITNGVYALRGRHFESHDYEQALASVGNERHQQARAAAQHAHEIGELSYEFILTKRARENMQLDLPQRFAQQLESGEYLLLNSNQPIKVNTKTAGRVAVTRLIRQLELAGVTVGSKITLRIDLKAKTATYEVASSES